MNIRGYAIVEKFTKKHADARKPFAYWRELTEAATWLKFEDVKKTFPAADAVGSCVVFDIGGNKYRLITKINYGEDIQVVDIQEALTHAEYNKDKWKRNCK